MSLDWELSARSLYSMSVFLRSDASACVGNPCASSKCSTLCFGVGVHALFSELATQLPVVPTVIRLILN